MLPVTDKLIKQMIKSDLPLEDRTALVTVLLDKLVALPITDAIKITPEGVKIGDRLLEIEQAISFREGCVAMVDNQARKVIREQIKYMAINMGVHMSLNLEQIYFAKAALWVMAEEDKLLEKIVI